MSILELKSLYPEECALIYEAGRYHEIYKLRLPEIQAAQDARRRSEEERKLERRNRRLTNRFMA
jgi:hypothetical protein